MSKKVRVGRINSLELVRKSAPPANFTFRTGAHRTKRDRPREKNWRKWTEEV